MYTDGPTNDEFPRNEYKEQIIKIIVFLKLDHFDLSTDRLHSSVESIHTLRGSFGSSDGTGNMACPYAVSSPSADCQLSCRFVSEPQHSHQQPEDSLSPEYPPHGRDLIHY